ncbi:MAG: bifunctional metallophosphatase/5'-nucleotidase [Verrucomicrobiae bacterium]|nr:bifunctional metallophosphatase/5'-nucleotidase [Verrucomicrobiae bacterium]
MKIQTVAGVLAVSAVLAVTIRVGHASPPPPDPFRLQILHASDLEGGVEAIGDAPNFAAVVEHLVGTEDHTVILSAGDNTIPGPFFNASADPGLRATLDAVNEAWFGVSGLDIREGAGRGDITVMNVIGFDASALGNHEFDAGTGVLREMIGPVFSGQGLGGVRWLGAQFPYLSANLDFTADGSLNPVFTNALLAGTAFRSQPDDLAAAAAAPKIAPAVTLERGGQLIGVVGATTPMLAAISSPGQTRVMTAGLEGMADLAAVLQPNIDQLLARGIDKIILVSHLQQLALERELIGLLRGVDVVIAGGSDSILANPENALRAGDVAVESYPIVTRNADGDPALVVSTDGQYKYVGRLVVTFDPQGRVLPERLDPAESGPWKTDDDGVQALWGEAGQPFAPGTRGALVRAVTTGVAGIVTAKDGHVLGRSSVFLEGRRLAVRTEESNLGNLTADANLWMARTVDPTTSISLKNGGGIRAEIGSIDGRTGELKPTLPNPLSGKQAGEISQLDIENSLRFNNRLTLVTVSAAGLKQLLEHGIAASRPGATPGQFPQVSGIECLYDLTRTPARFHPDGSVMTPGERVRHLRVTGWRNERSDVLVRDGEWMGDPGRTFRVVTLNFLADPQATQPGLGGDGYPFPAVGHERLDLAPVLADRPGTATFAPPGSEQDALAEYLLAAHPTFAYSEPETVPSLDRRLADLAVAAPRFFSVRPVDAGMELVFPTVAGRTYRLQHSSEVPGPWEPHAAGVLLGDDLTRTLVDPVPSASVARFYRLMEVTTLQAQP